MNFMDIGNEYLHNAEVIRAKMDSIQSELGSQQRRMKAYDQREYFRRLSILDSMYIDCLTIGKCLVRRGAAANGEKSSA